MVYTLSYPPNSHNCPFVLLCPFDSYEPFDFLSHLYPLSPSECLYNH